MKSLGCLLVLVVLGFLLLPAPALAAVSVGVRVADHERTLPQLSAVTVAQDTALQTRLGAQLARHLAGATTGYQRLDELSMNLHERRLKLYAGWAWGRCGSTLSGLTAPGPERCPARRGGVAVGWCSADGRVPP
ncbi:hypothetical protein [Stenotrophomonas sp. SrG]|uniref:hypothetical protein n=1 Tax=Stenotrophomonas sp. SrG TaxID=3414430 RepID=UPI003CFAFC99